MTIHSIYQIIGVKVNIYQFFSTVLKRYQLLKDYTHKISQQFPKGVDDIVKGYVNYYDIGKIYKDFQEHINLSYEKDVKKKADDTTISEILKFLDERFQIFNDVDDMSVDQMSDFLSDVISDVINTNYELDNFVLGDRSFDIIYHEVPHDVDDGYVVIGCFINKIPTSVRYLDISGIDYLIDIDYISIIRDRIKDKLLGLGFDEYVNLHTVPDYCQCCT